MRVVLAARTSHPSSERREVRAWTAPCKSTDGFWGRSARNRLMVNYTIKMVRCRTIARVKSARKTVISGEGHRSNLRDVPITEGFASH
jgi:hypothetical protein